jgi:hypothetical protein
LVASMCAVERLNLAVLIDIQLDSAFRRRQVEPNNIAYFPDKQRASDGTGQARYKASFRSGDDLIRIDLTAAEWAKLTAPAQGRRFAS